MAENIETTQELAEMEEVNTAANLATEEIQIPSEVPPTKEDGPLEEMDPSKPNNTPKPSPDISEINNPAEVSDKLSSTEQEKIEVSEEGMDLKDLIFEN